MMSYSRLILRALLVLAVVVAVSAKKRKNKVPVCTDGNIAGTDRTCVPEKLNGGKYEKNVECTWACKPGCKWTSGPRTRVCKGRPGVWKKLVKGKYQTSKGIKCSCRPCNTGPGGWPGYPGPSGCASPYIAGTLCDYACPTGYTRTGTRKRLCFNGNWRNVDNNFGCTDIDECADGTHDCEGTCTNTDGSYECCPGGFIWTGDDCEPAPTGEMPTVVPTADV